MPPRSFFVKDFMERRGYTPDEQQLHEHLTWIKRFYQGWTLAPTGWNKMSERLLTSIGSDKEKKLVELKLKSFGKIISTEWAQDNHIRKINTAHISIWGSALKKSVELQQQVEIVKLIEQDIYGLINGSVNTKDIFSERYYASEDYNDF